MKNKIRNPKSNSMKNKKELKFNDIKTPTTVEEFRENLKKYFLHFLRPGHLYVSNSKNGLKYVTIKKLNCLDDLYNLCNGTPLISVKVNPIKGFEDFMVETNQYLSLNGYFMNEKNFEIIENQSEFITKYTPKWIGIDNKLYREFFYLTLGEYSGYSI